MSDTLNSAIARMGVAAGLREARDLCLAEMVDGNVSAEDEAYNTAIRHCCDAIDAAIAKLLAKCAP